MADRPKKFIKGHNVLKSKGSSKQISKVKELERKKVRRLIKNRFVAILNHFFDLLSNNHHFNAYIYITLSFHDVEVSALT